MTTAAFGYAANCRAWPAVEGPFPVGTVEFEVTDPLRSSQYAPAPTLERRLYARVWYPAATVAGHPRRPYFTEAEATIVPAALLGVAQQPTDALREGARLLTNSHSDAPPAPGRFPVVGFNHGYTSYPAQQTALFERLAANGYVVVSVGHPYESGGIVYPNGDAVTMSPRILADLAGMMTLPYFPAYAAPTLAEQLAAHRELVKGLRQMSMGRLPPVWRDDVYFVLDRLEDGAVPDAAAPVAGAIDHHRRGYMGMSFGAYIAGMLAQGDPKARAVVHLDGGCWTHELIDTDLRTPFLTIGSDLWAVQRAAPDLPPGISPIVREPLGPRTPAGQDLAYERLTRAGLRPDGYRFVVPGVYHLGIADTVELFGEPTMRAILGEPEAITRFTAIQNDLVQGFLDRHLKGKPSDFPKSALAAHPEVIVQDLSWLRERATAAASG
jgi:hypothetical protein